MSVSVRSITRTGKPEGLISLDRAHRLAKGLVGVWIFNESGGGVFYDLTDNNDGALVGTNWIRDTGAHGRQISNANVGNITDRVDLGSIASTNPLSLAGQIEASFVFRASHVNKTASNDFPRLIDKSDGNQAANGWAIHGGINASSQLEFYTAGTREFRSTNFFEGTGFHLGVLARDADGTSRLYRGGAQRTIIADKTGIAFSSITTNAAIGNWNHTTNRAWGGAIEFVYVYNRALTPSEAGEISADPYVFLRRKRRFPGFFVAGGVITHTAAAIATGIAARGQTTIFANRNATASGVADAGKLVLKSVVATASGVAATTIQQIGGVILHTAAAVATVTVTVNKTVFKTVQSTASGLAGVAASAGNLFFHTAAAIATGIASRSLLVLKTVKEIQPPRITSTTLSEQSSDATTLTLSMPDERPDGDFYIAAVRNNTLPETAFMLPPAGWTTLITDSVTTNGWIGFRVGSDEPASYEVTSNAPTVAGLWLGAVVRVSSVTAIDVSDTALDLEVVESPSVTPTVAATLILRVASYARFPGLEDITSTPDTELFRESLRGETPPLPLDTLIGNTASFESGGLGVASGLGLLGDDDPPLRGITATIAFAPDPTPTGLGAFGIARVFLRVITNFSSFTGHAGIGMADEIRSRWRRRVSNWRRRR